jgi:hypothetical protein
MSYASKKNQMERFPLLRNGSSTGIASYSLTMNQPGRQLFWSICSLNRANRILW